MPASCLPQTPSHRRPSPLRFCQNNICGSSSLVFCLEMKGVCPGLQGVRMRSIYNVSVLSVWERGNKFSFRCAAVPKSCVPLLSFGHLQSHLLALLEKARRVKVWRSHSWGKGPPGYQTFNSFYPFALMMHLGNYKSKKSSLGTFPTKSWSDHLSTSSLLKLPPRHPFTLCHAHSGPTAGPCW